MNAEIERLFDLLRRRVAAEPELTGLDLVSNAQPSIRLITHRVSADRIELGKSRMGGIPDVPPGWEWPRWAPKEVPAFSSHPGTPAPLGFIAQIDLAATPKLDDSLPGSGWLYFFYDRYCERWGFDPDDRGCCRVYYTNCDRSTLIRAELPGDFEKDHVAHPCVVEACLDLNLSEDHPDFGDDSGPDAYWRFLEDWERRLGAQHHLLGDPQIVQGPMELECQLASNGVYCGDGEGYKSEKAKRLAAGARDWRLLLQIDTDEKGPGWMWGDLGRIYFWIRREDLRLLRFDDVWLVLQCGWRAAPKVGNSDVREFWWPVTAHN